MAIIQKTLKSTDTEVVQVVCYCLLTQLTQNLAPSNGTENVYLQSNLLPAGLQLGYKLSNSNDCPVVKNCE